MTSYMHKTKCVPKRATLHHTAVVTCSSPPRVPQRCRGPAQRAPRCPFSAPNPCRLQSLQDGKQPDSPRAAGLCQAQSCPAEAATAPLQRKRDAGQRGYLRRGQTCHPLVPLGSQRGGGWAQEEGLGSRGVCCPQPPAPGFSSLCHAANALAELPPFAADTGP